MRKTQLYDPTGLTVKGGRQAASFGLFLSEKPVEGKCTGKSSDPYFPVTLVTLHTSPHSVPFRRARAASSLDTILREKKRVDGEKRKRKRRWE